LADGLLVSAPVADPVPMPPSCARSVPVAENSQAVSKNTGRGQNWSGIGYMARVLIGPAGTCDTLVNPVAGVKGRLRLRGIRLHPLPPALAVVLP